jgi:hypothetical protein
LPDLPDQSDLQDQQEGPDQQLLWPQLLPVKVLFLSLKLWGDSKAAEIEYFKLKQNDKKQNIQNKAFHT